MSREDMSVVASKSISSKNFRQVLLSGVSAAAIAALAATGPANAQSVPGTFLSMEGGAACGFGDELGAPSNVPGYSGSGFFAGLDFNIRNIRSGLEVGNDGCGWTGRLGFGSNKSGLFGVGSSWGIFVRHTDLNSDDGSAGAMGDLAVDVSGPGPAYTVTVPNYYNGTVTGGYEAKRTVVDFEVGQNVGIGSGAKTQVFAGIRYARFKSETDISGSFASPFTSAYIGPNRATVSSESEFNGAGPRLGVRTSIPVSNSIAVSLSGSGSILWGRREVETNSALSNRVFGIPPTVSFAESESENSWVGNIEGEAALSFTPFGPNAQIELGVRAEGWFRDGSDYTATFGGGERQNNHNWGPFGRVVIGLN